MTPIRANEQRAAGSLSWLASIDAKAAALLRGLAFRPYAATLALIVLCGALYLPGIASLPPTDRDEARFAQASKQMLETGNYVDIRFQTEARYKKPIGIYWLQSAAVTAA
ncbi:MAG: ArnT family glycosyltransferase, partial [Rhodomicrobium sp.]